MYIWSIFSFIGLIPDDNFLILEGKYLFCFCSGNVPVQVFIALDMFWLSTKNFELKQTFK